MIFEVARRDQFCCVPMHEGCRRRLEHRCDSTLGQHVPVFGAIGHDIEQSDRHTGVRDVCSNGAAHLARADDGNLAEFGHSADLKYRRDSLTAADAHCCERQFLPFAPHD